MGRFLISPNAGIIADAINVQGAMLNQLDARLHNISNSLVEMNKQLFVIADVLARADMRSRGVNS